MTTLCEARHPNFNTNGSRLTVAEGGASMGAHSLGQSSTTASSPDSKKVGSFQEFVRSECSMDDLSPSLISVDEVHKIAILDIRLMNADRNSANLLCRRRRDNKLELVPIDHGFCLRAVADVCGWMDWCWLDWPQLKQPMSKQTKKYIANLDIEKDVKILRERLNICDEAIAYFYASSSILKAGTKAGLSLYEIATMCCRNDDAGQVPSKLEILFDMAGELAQSAVQNSRWGHAAAQRALVDQLSPHGGSLLTPNSKKSSLSRRAASAFDLNGLVSLSDTSSHRSTQAEGHMPSMIQSAGSDSSSDTDEGGIDGCDEWAAALIKNVSIDTNQKLMKTKPRSHSVESDGSSDSSADGFWQKSPGSLNESDDESSINWSPASSPSREILEGSFLNESRMSYNPFEPARRSSFRRGDETLDSSVASLSKIRTPTKVTFAGLSTLDQVSNVNHDDDPRFKHSNSDVGNKATPLPGIQKSNMRRSQSYSALSSNMSSQTHNDDEKAALKKRSRTPSYSDEEYKNYYLKFVELVIEREVTAAVYAKQDE